MYYRRHKTRPKADGVYAKPTNRTRVKSPAAQITFPRDLFLRLAEEAVRRQLSFASVVREKVASAIAAGA